MSNQKARNNGEVILHRSINVDHCFLFLWGHHDDRGDDLKGMPEMQEQCKHIHIICSDYNAASDGCFTT